MLTALTALIHPYTQDDQVPIPIILANRTRREVKNIIACFVNPGVVVGDCTGNPLFSGLLESVRCNMVGILARQEQSGNKVQFLLQRRSRHPSKLTKHIWKIWGGGSSTYESIASSRRKFLESK